MQFAQEKLTDVLDELGSLIKDHQGEVSFLKDHAIDPDMGLYHSIEKSGALKIFTARDDSEALCGYAFFLVKCHPHYKKSIQAMQDLLFIHPKKRGFGHTFIAWCDDQLRTQGVEFIYHSVSAKMDFSPILKRIGYELVENIYMRRLTQSSETKGVH